MRHRSLPDLETRASVPRLVSARVNSLGTFDPTVGMLRIAELILYMDLIRRDAYHGA